MMIDWISLIHITRKACHHSGATTARVGTSGFPLPALPRIRLRATRFGGQERGRERSRGARLFLSPENLYLVIWR
jgi:hypothetical protein